VEGTEEELRVRLGRLLKRLGKQGLVRPGLHTSQPLVGADETRRIPFPASVQLAALAVSLWSLALALSMLAFAVDHDMACIG
jgi:hypothetical protein